MTLTKHIHHVHKPHQAHHPNQMHAQVIIHDLPHLPHNTTAPMHQCMFMFILFMQDINPNYQSTNKACETCYSINLNANQG